MKLTHILAIIVATALPSAALLAQGEKGKMGDMMKKEQPANMSEMHQKMEAEMKAQDAELDKLVSDMNTATGEKKADAMAALLGKIVGQRKTMHEKMAGMHMDMKGTMDCCKEGMKSKAQSSATPGTE